MNEQDQEYMMRVFESSAMRNSRVAIILNQDDLNSLRLLREQHDVFSILSLKELTSALIASEVSPLRVLDIRHLPLEDSKIFAECLSGATGAKESVYVLTPEQFANFQEVNFDIVLR